MSEPTLEQRYEVICNLLVQALDADDRLERASSDVRKYWLDWPQERRAAVRSLSSFLADALAELCNAVAECERFREERLSIEGGAAS